MSARDPRSDLASVPVRDVMQGKIVSFAATTSIEEALQTLEDSHIGGAPVIGSMGELVGVLSVHDVLRAAQSEGTRRTGRGYYFTDPFQDDDDSVWSDAEVFLDSDGSALGREFVRDWMNPSIVSVEPDACLGDVCEIMLRQGIHRVLVVEGSRLCGIVSTFDIVRYLAGVGAPAGPG